jgi:hypothetical protein
LKDWSCRLASYQRFPADLSNRRESFLNFSNAILNSGEKCDYATHEARQSGESDSSRIRISWLHRIRNGPTARLICDQGEHDLPNQQVKRSRGPFPKHKY